MGDGVMVDLIIAALACAAFLALVWWYDVTEPAEWADLLSPAARVAHSVLAEKFRLEERVVDAFLSADFLTGLIPDRLDLLRRLGLYSRIVEAMVPPPKRVRARLSVLRQGFASLRPKAFEQAREELHALDTETLESWRVVLSVVTGEPRTRS